MSRSAPRFPVRRVIASVVATLSLVFGGLFVTTGPAVADPGSGTITGTIAGPSGAVETQVALYALSPRYGDWRETFFSTYSSGGAYELTPEPGEYRLCARGVQATTFPVATPGSGPACYGGSDAQSATTITLGDGETITANITAPGSTTITGTVVADDGFGETHPAADAVVFAYEPNGQGGWTQVGGLVEIDDDGNYEVPLLKGGEYRVCAKPFFGTPLPQQHECTGGGPWVQDGASVTVATGAELSGVDLTMPLGGELGGHVTGDGSPLTSVSVSLRFVHDDGSEMFFFASTSDGDYVFPGLSSGTYRICFSDSGGYAGGFIGECWQDAEPVEVDIEQPWIYDYDAELVRGATISGAVTNVGGGVPNFTNAMLYRNVAGEWVGSGGQQTNFFSGGTYSFGPLDPGTYRVCADINSLQREDRCWDDVATLDAATDIVVAAGDEAADRNIELPLATLVTVTGDVTFDGAPPSGEPYGDIRAFVDDNGVWRSVSIANVQSDLSFSMDLPAGVYRFCASVLFQSWAPTCYGGTVVQEALDVSVPTSGPGPVLGFEFVPGATVSGTIRNTAGDGLADTAVTARILTESGGWAAVPNAVYAVADFYGNYSTGPLPPGTYLIRFADVMTSGSTYVAEYHDDSLTVEGATLLELEVGESLDLDAVLALEGEVTPGEVGIAGVPQIPNELTADAGVWAPEPDSFAYQWLVGDQPIDGETGATLQLTSDLVDQDVSVRVEAQYGDEVVERVSDPVTILPIFADVASNHFFSNEILWMRQQSISNGYLDEQGIRTYHPLESVSRQAMAAFLYRLAGSPEFDAPATPSFSDVPTTHPFFAEIEWLKAEGITVGNADGTFAPDDAVSRQAMAAFLYRYADSPEFTPPAEPSFTDLAAGAPFYLEVEWLLSQGITTGYDDGDTFSYHPLEDVSRQSMAVFLYRTEE